MGVAVGQPRNHEAPFEIDHLRVRCLVGEDLSIAAHSQKPSIGNGHSLDNPRRRRGVCAGSPATRWIKAPQQARQSRSFRAEAPDQPRALTEPRRWISSRRAFSPAQVMNSPKSKSNVPALRFTDFSLLKRRLRSIYTVEESSSARKTNAEGKRRKRFGVRQLTAASSGRAYSPCGSGSNFALLPAVINTRAP